MGSLHASQKWSFSEKKKFWIELSKFMIKATTQNQKNFCFCNLIIFELTNKIWHFESLWWGVKELSSLLNFSTKICFYRGKGVKKDPNCADVMYKWYLSQEGFHGRQNSQCVKNCDFGLFRFLGFSLILFLQYKMIKFIYSEKATKFCEIFTLLLTVSSPYF